MKADFHIHSSFSADSEAPMEQMIEKGISLGLTTMCFTEHMDFGFLSEGLLFETDTAAYHKKLMECRDKYGGRVELLFGIELGLEPHMAGKLSEYLSEWDFDFVIGSSHVVEGRDPYYPQFYTGRLEEECYREYFATIPENLRAFSDIDVYGHIDYVVRYGPNQNRFYSYEKYRDLIDEGLREIVSRGIGLELNTAGYKYGLGHPNPHPDVLQRYRTLGGEIITVGSDGHATGQLAYEFGKVRGVLENCGFRYYTVFRKRKPEFIKF